MTFSVPGGHEAEVLADALAIGAAMGLAREETLLRLFGPQDPERSVPAGEVTA